jgi:excisionase family DNA binding protein
VHRKTITQNELNLAADQLVRSIGALVVEYPTVVDELVESLFYIDHPNAIFVERIHASASGPLNIDEVMSTRQKAWTVPELAKLHNLSTRGLYDHIKSGRLPSYQIGTAIRLCPATTQAWFRSCLMPPNGSR